MLDIEPVTTNPVVFFQVGAHQIQLERVDKQLWKVTIDGRRYATFCSESRARAAGRAEAKRLKQRR